MVTGVQTCALPIWLVVGIDPGGGTGALVRTRPERAAALVRDLARGQEPRAEEIAMVRAEADDGQELTALNEVFLGDVGHSRRATC